MTPEQNLRLFLLRLAVEGGACADWATEAAMDFEDYVLTNYGDDEPDEDVVLQ
jgi:hypothetical protein